MSIDYSLLPLSKGTPRALASRWKATAHDRKLAKAYETVNLREDNCCQISGVRLYPTARELQLRRQHHHLKGRNVKPEWVYDAARIILVSEFIHRLLTAKVILVEGTDATKPLRFTWNRNLVEPGKEIVRLARVT